MNNSTSNPAADWLLAVDAGGTKTNAWLVELNADGAAQVLGRGRSTGGNPLSVGFTEATRAICDAVSQARGEAQQPDAPLSCAIMSIAGAADAAMRNKLIAWAHEIGLAEKVAIVSDFLPVLAAGTRDCCGVALISGTGSSAFARNADGRTARCGGWGYLLGDEGSGFAIGRAALQLALRRLEAGMEPTPLTYAVLESLGANSVSEVTQAVYRNADVRAHIAALAPLVIDAARNDPHAQSLLDSAARDLADLVARAARTVDLATGSIEVAVCGSLLVNAQPLRDRLHAEFKKLRLDCRIHVVDDPLQGCLRLAAPEFAGTLVTWL